MKKMMILLASLVVCFGCQKSDDVQPINESEMTRAKYSVTVIARPVCSFSGTVTGAGVFSIGDTCTVVAMSNNGRGFAGWYNESGVRKSNKSNYTFVVEGRTIMEARFSSVNGFWRFQPSAIARYRDLAGMSVWGEKLVNTKMYYSDGRPFPNEITLRSGAGASITSSSRASINGVQLKFSHWEDADSGAFLSSEPIFSHIANRDMRVFAVYDNL